MRMVVTTALIAGLAAFATVSPAKGRDRVMTTEGRSMRPALPTERTVIVVREVPWDDLRPGCIVVYTHPRIGLITHRLVRKTPKGWWVKGDANRLCDDEWVTPNNIIGVVVEVRRSR